MIDSNSKLFEHVYDQMETLERTGFCKGNRDE